MLVVADDGIGMTESANLTKPRSGLRLLASLALQLDATLTETTATGTRFELKFRQT
jgi:two-component sensor histidine kinase